MKGSPNVEIDEAIYAAMGWHYIREAGVWQNKQNISFHCPQFTEDLNAMHEAEKVLTDEQWVTYYDEVCDAVERFFPAVKPYSIAATAAQRAEAFLRTLSLWQENPQRAPSANTL